MATNNIIILGNLPAGTTMRIGISGPGYNRAPLLEAIKKAFDPDRKEIITMEDMKYFRLTAYTPYCGEELTAVTMAPSEEDVRLEGLCDRLMEDCAAEWFDPEDYETYGYEDEQEYEEAFYQECGCNIEEITKEEYEEEKEKW